MPFRAVFFIVMMGGMGVATLILPMPIQAQGFHPRDQSTGVTTCSACTYQPTGDLIQDGPGLVGYLLCLLRQVYFCWLNQTLALIFRYIVYIVMLIQSLAIWWISQADALLRWFIGTLLTLVFWIGGMIQNVGNEIIAAQNSSVHITTVTSGSSNFFDVLIALVNGLSGAINSLTTGISSIVSSLAATLSTLIVQLGQVITTALNDTLGVLLALINAILIIVVTIVQTIGVIVLAFIQMVGMIISTLLDFILALLQGVIGGFQTTITNPLASIPGMSVQSGGVGSLSPGSSGGGAVIGSGTGFAGVSGGGGSGGSTSVGTGITGICNSNVMIHLCIGAYILDNTLFSSSSPATVAVSILIGAIWFERIIWAIRKVSSITVSYE